MSASAARVARARTLHPASRLARRRASPHVPARRAERVPASQLGTRTNRRRRGRRLGRLRGCLAAGEARFRRDPPGRVPQPRRPVSGLAHRQRPRRRGWLQGLLAPLQEHRRPVRRVAHRSLHPLHLLRLLRSQGQGDGSPRVRRSPSPPRAPRHPPVHLPLLPQPLPRGSPLRGAARARPPSLRRRRRRLPSLRRAKRPRRLPRRRRFESHRWRQSRPLRRVPRPRALRADVRSTGRALRRRRVGRPLRVRPRAPGRFRRALVSRHRRRANLSTVDQSHPKRRRFDPRRKTRLVHHSGRSPGRLRRRLRLETETSRASRVRVGRRSRLRARRRRRTPTSS